MRISWVKSVSEAKRLSSVLNKKFHEVVQNFEIIPSLDLSHKGGYEIHCVMLNNPPNVLEQVRDMMTGYLAGYLDAESNQKRQMRVIERERAKRRGY